MAERTNFSVDGGAPVVLQNLPDIGDWRKFGWSDVATIPLIKGAHTALDELWRRRLELGRVRLFQ